MVFFYEKISYIIIMDFKNSKIKLNLPRENKFVSPRVYVHENNFMSHEPMGQFRFILTFPSSNGHQSWYLYSVSSPRVKQDFARISDYHTTNYIPTAFQWEPMEIFFKEPMSPLAQESLMEWVRVFSESHTNRMGYGGTYKKNIQIEKLDPTGIAVETWIINGVMIREINIDQLTDVEDININMTVIYDSCIVHF